MASRSNRSERASHQVASYLQQHGRRIIPINPTYAGQSIGDAPFFNGTATRPSALTGPQIVMEPAKWTALLLPHKALPPSAMKPCRMRFMV
ncbi:CoA-binding protein [Noviherbaspirillum suwonense]|uniref:CoA-binding protein n=1 Tax=Noviherbaspirillum suwonense TaxID=1224511 RepID=UPI0024B71B89|nr:CoA-binding protein [Noviherbaspirillum suwonense]